MLPYAPDLPVATLAAAFPDAQLLQLPPDWFDQAFGQPTIFTNFYAWLVEKQHEPAERLPSRTYVGRALLRRLLACEHRRLRRLTVFRSETIEQAVAFANLNSGPMTQFADRRLVGDALVVLPLSAAGSSHLSDVIYRGITTRCIFLPFSSVIVTPRRGFINASRRTGRRVNGLPPS